LPAQFLHHRTTIRRAVVTVLRNVTDQPLRIHDSKPIPLQAKHLPLVSVRTVSESVTDSNQFESARILTRALVVEVEIVRAANTGDGAGTEEALAEILDSDCRAVELAVTNDETLLETVQQIVLESTALRYESDANTPLGIALLTFAAQYEQPAQETVLPEFALGTVQWDLAPPDGIIDAEDSLDVEE
jgi:hypothetical protein